MILCGDPIRLLCVETPYLPPPHWYVGGLLREVPRGQQVYPSARHPAAAGRGQEPSGAAGSQGRQAAPEGPQEGGSGPHRRSTPPARRPEAHICQAEVQGQEAEAVRRPRSQAVGRPPPALAGFRTLLLPLHLR
jgi:hypothetical protein